MIGWTIVLALAFTGGCNAFLVENSAEFGNNCDTIPEYRDLYALSLHVDECVSVNNMWSYLGQLQRKNETCMKKIVEHMDNVFLLLTNSSHCVCTGQYTQHTRPHITSAHHTHCSHQYPDYKKLEDEIYNSRPLPCRSHQYVWHYLAGISHDKYTDCQVNLILEAAVTYPDIGRDPCSCHSAATNSTTTETATMSTIIHTTSKIQPLSSTIVPLLAGTTSTNSETTTVSTTIITTSKTLSTALTSPMLLDVHVCNKLSTLTDIAYNLTVMHANASVCAAGDHASSEALVLSNCNVSTTTVWKQGENVMMMCDRIPLYTPVATFSGEGVYLPNGGKAGIFLGCYLNGFKMAVQECEQGTIIQHLTTGGMPANDPSNYFLVSW